MNSSSDERFCGKYSVRFQVGGKSTLVYSPADQSSRIVPHNLALLLDRCRSFRTLDQHAQSCANFLRQSNRGAETLNPESVRKHIAALVKDGFLISEKEVLAACHLSDQAPPEIASVGVVTRDRTESMDRCLRSYIENSKKYGRSNNFVVVDDSESLTGRQRNKERLLSLKQEYDVDISYAGREEKMRLAASLVSEGGFDPDLLNFALINSGDHEFSCGKNRNALFLQTIGDLVFSTDDDAVCRLATPPQSDHEYEQEPRGQPLTPIEFWFFTDRQEALSSAAFVEEDLLAAHEQLLGRGLGECLAEFDDVGLLGMERPISHHLQSVASGEGRVLVTLTGMIGDSGIRVPVTHRILNPASRQRLIASKETYLTGRSSREVLRVATRACVSNRTWFVSTALGYDNRDLLPPFFPVLRGTDGIFSATLSRCYEYGYVADVPRAILHAPNRSGTYDRDAVMQSARGITMHALIITCLNSRQVLAGLNDNAEGMRKLGSHIIEIGSMKLRDFEEFIRLHLWREQGNAMSNLERDLLDYHNPPAYWVHDLKQYLAEMQRSLTKPDYVVPKDLRDGHSLEEARELSRQLVSQFGQLLSHWPDIVEAARRLRARGDALTIGVSE
jgi:hypothetical protein